MKIRHNNLTRAMNKRHISSRPHKDKCKKRSNNLKHSWKEEILMKKNSSVHSVWGHHDTMIVNLQDWVTREINILRFDLGKETPHLEDDPNVLKLLKSADDMNVQLFDLIRNVVDRAEIETAKLKKTQPASVEKVEA